jgi:type I restriction enzyme S subunit
MIAIEGWKNQKLSDLADYINGYAFKPDNWGEDGLPIIRIEQLKNPDAPTDYYSGKLPTKNIIENGDLIFSWSASLFLRIWQNGRAALNQHLFKVVEKEDVDKVFLKLFIEFYLPELTKASHGSTMQHITRKELDRFNAPFPISKAEQIKIAKILSTVDRAIEQTEALIAKQQRIKTGLMQDLLTRGIDEHGNLRSEQTHKFKDSPLGRIPVEWEVKTLNSCVRNDGPICYGILMPGSGYDSGVPVIKVKDVMSGKILQNSLLLTDPKIDSQYKRSKLRGGDLLVTIRGTTGRVAIVPDALDGANITQDTARIRLKEEHSNIYFYFLLQSKHVQDQVLLHTLGQAVKGINIAEVKKLSFGLPALNEQQMIAERLNEMEESLCSTDHELNKFNAIKTALMLDLLTGRKQVTQLLDSEKTTN